MTEVLPYLNIFMTQELTDEERAELEAMQIEIREQLSANAPASDVSGNDVSGNDVSGNTTDTGGDSSAEDTTAGENSSAARPAGDDPLQQVEILQMEQKRTIRMSTATGS